ncbi:MAG: hypothetical protein JWO31_2720, partial [Phycisphaerales bacterium]|nr:hypothetical protein [Phycisphaerales bacterium]
GQDSAVANPWRAALRPLLAPAAGGWWRPAGRLLYDLQRVCVDHEREIYSVNVVEWLATLCRKPLYRPLPRQRLAMAARHLAAAAHRLAGCQVTGTDRDRVGRLLHAAHHAAEHRLRAALAPGVHDALDAVDLVPQNAVEAAGREKLVQELLDAVLRDGYLTFGGVRDTISRNAMRCHDLRTAAEWAGYDQLMKLDVRLGDALDGVYRRGEVYRYLFQKLSSLLFANPVGRLLTRTLILPVAGAYLLLEALQHTLGTLLAKVFHTHTHLLPVWKPPPDPVADAETAQRVADQFDPNLLYKHPHTFVPWVLTAVLILLLINWPAFRRWAGRATAAGFRWLAFVLIELPDRLVRNPVVLATANSRAVRSTFRHGVKPLVVAAAFAWLFLYHKRPSVQAAGFVAVFIAAGVLLNSRPGRAAEQAALYAIRVGWVRFTADKIGTFFRGIMRFFGRLLEAADRALYAVDEWLRFRHGGGRAALVGKAVLGVAWFYVAYVFRFALNLLVEPQVNPIKHFPVVTVSHKLLLPLAIPGRGAPSPLGGVLVWLFGASKGTADAVAATVVWGIPGIFGFLAWELRENWKLYRANLPSTVQPVRFGSHGESVAQLLRPGFHSGTLPKAFAKVRSALAKAPAPGPGPASGVEVVAAAGAEPAHPALPPAAHKHLETVEHVEESVRWYVDRAFLGLLNRHPAFADLQVRLADVRLGPTRIVLLFDCPAACPDPLRIEFEQVAGWVVAEVPARGWTTQLNGAAGAQFAVALRGFFKMSAVDLVQGDVDACFAPRAVRWRLRPKVLVVRPDERPEVEATYALHEREMSPDFDAGPADPSLPILAREKVLFRASDVTWAEWVNAWDVPRPPNSSRPA